MGASQIIWRIEKHDLRSIYKQYFIFAVRNCFQGKRLF